MAQPLESPPSEDKSWLKPFLLIWTGQAFSLIGSSLVQFALIWWMTKTTDSAIVLTTGSLVAMIPGVFLGPFVGALVDRWNRKLVMMVSDGAIALATLVLVTLFWTGQIQIWHIYVISFLRGLGNSFHWPAMQSSISLMVPARHLARVQGVNQALNGALLIATPPLGALLISLVPMYQVTLIDVVTAIIAVSMLALVAIPQPEREVVDVTPRLVLADLREGIRYISRWKGVMMLIAIALIVNFLLAPALVLLPLMVTRVFQGNQWHLGAINSAQAIGMLAGGILLGAWGGFKNKMTTSVVGLVGMGAGAVVFGLAPEGLFGMALGGMGLMGAMIPLTDGPVHAILQERITPEMQGRVFTLLQSGASAIAPLAMIIAGPLAEVIGLRSWYVIAAAGCVLMAVAARLSPPLMNLDHPSSVPTPERVVEA